MNQSVTLREFLQRRCRKTARERIAACGNEADQSCYSCGCSDGLEVHHRDGDYLNNRLINLIVVCHWCHRDIHRQRQTRDRIHEMKRHLTKITKQ